jgi:hypothetical protein
MCDYSESFLLNEVIQYINIVAHLLRSTLVSTQFIVIKKKNYHRKIFYMRLVQANESDTFRPQ